MLQLLCLDMQTRTHSVSHMNSILHRLPTPVNQNKDNSIFAFSWTYSPSCLQVVKVTWGQSARISGHVQRNWDVEDSSRSQGHSALICWNSWKIWLGFSVCLNCASFYIHAPCCHPNISVIFKGLGILYVFHLTSSIHMPMTTVCFNFFFLPQRHKVMGWFISVSILFLPWNYFLSLNFTSGQSDVCYSNNTKGMSSLSAFCSKHKIFLRFQSGFVSYCLLLEAARTDTDNGGSFVQYNMHVPQWSWLWKGTSRCMIFLYWCWWGCVGFLGSRWNSFYIVYFMSESLSKPLHS